MNIAILHYHLNRGGVTQVIINHLLALDRHLNGEVWNVAILFSGRHDAWLEQLTHLQCVKVTLCPLAALDYDLQDDLTAHPQNLGEQILDQLDELHFDKCNTIIHAHNHVLAKNASLPGALVWLAERGFPMLLQIHDFPEDYRPLDYRRLVVAARSAEKIARCPEDATADSGLPRESNARFGYPQAPHLHYAVLNRRDERVLKAAGVPQDRRHLLPNPVAEPAEWFPRETARRRLHKLFDVDQRDRYVLYPVRCIRRKNIGEAVLWSLLAPQGTTVGFTLPPENPVFAPIYQSWKKQAAALQLPCRFEVGKEGGMRFVENLAASDLILTTSLVEGFGMVYLETWLSGHSLAGRDLPEITADFVGSGLVLDDLRPHVEAPVDWVGAERFRHLLENGFKDVMRQFGVVPKTDHDALRRRIEHRCDTGRLDFGELDEELQQEILQKAAANHSARSELDEINNWIPRLLGPNANGTPTVVRNAVATLKNYGFQTIGQRLTDVYTRVAASERADVVTGLEQPRQILDHFLDARRYRPIAT